MKIECFGIRFLGVYCDYYGEVLAHKRINPLMINDIITFFFFPEIDCIWIYGNWLCINIKLVKAINLAK